jgi:DNA-binding YbaB/EbfC family protein
MKGMGGGLQNIMRQANQMQMKMKKVQDEMALKEFSGTAGGDAILVTVTGALTVKSVKIKPDVMSAGDLDMLQDLVVAATNDAIKIARETSEKEMSKITGGMNIPGMF